MPFFIRDALIAVVAGSRRRTMKTEQTEKHLGHAGHAPLSGVGCIPAFFIRTRRGHSKSRNRGTNQDTYE